MRVLASALLAALSCVAADSAIELERARALQQAGKLGEAQAIYHGLLRAATDPKLEGAIRLELSRVHLAEGDYPEALAEGSKAAALARSKSDRTLEGNGLTVTGLARMYMGQYPAALKDFEEALRAAHDTGDNSQAIVRLNNIGTVLYYQGSYADAIARYREALKLVEAHPHESWNASRRQLTVANIATIYQRLGQYRNALDTYIAMRSSPVALPVSEQAQLLGNMGALYRRLGDPVKALETYRAAQGLYRESAMNQGEIAVLNNIGIVQALDLHRPEDALRSFGEALAMSRESDSKPLELQSRLYRGETLLQLKRLPAAEQEFSQASALAHSLRAQEDQWKALYGLARIARSKGQADDAVRFARSAVSIIETLRSSAAGVSSRGGFLADKRQVYDFLIDLQIRAPRIDVADLFRLMEESRARSLKDQKGASAAPDIAAVRRNLDAQTLFVEYWVGSDAMAAVWITATQEGAWSERDVPNLRADLAALATALSTRDSEMWRDQAKRVVPMLFAGVKAQLSSGKVARMTIVPDRELARIPFEALPVPWSEAQRVLNLASVAYVPTASLLHPRVEGRGIVPFWSRILLAFADPSPGAEGAGDLPSAAGSGRLPAAAKEVREVAALLGGQHTEHVGADARKAYLDVERTEPYRVLHLATHASVDPEDANRSYILFAPALGSGQYDYLFLKELYSLDLRNVDLVTASACETQSGEFVEGEGTENFSQAFLLAGARSVVTSLWRVSDRSTEALMWRFYRGLAEGREAADALREAKVEYLLTAPASEQAPFYWAAFVLNGDGSVRLPFVVSWTVAASVSLALIALGLFVWSRRAARR